MEIDFKVPENAGLDITSMAEAVEALLDAQNNWERAINSLAKNDGFNIIIRKLNSFDEQRRTVFLYLFDFLAKAFRIAIDSPEESILFSVDLDQWIIFLIEASSVDKQMFESNSCWDESDFTLVKETGRFVTTM
jgi:hypothetical protein